MRYFIWVVVFITAAGVIAAQLWKIEAPKSNLMNTSIYVTAAPFSPDPYKFDYQIHHIVYGSIFAKLVSQYKQGEIVGVLAQSWRSDSEGKTWTFKIRSGMKFTNGELITAESIALSIKRLLLVANRHKSGLDILHQIVGASNLSSMESPLIGVSAVGDQLIIQLNEQNPKLLDILSFGLFGIVHHSNFNKTSGDWLPETPLVSSGPYEITTSGAADMILSLRSDYPAYLRHKNAFQRVRITWNPEDRYKSEISSGFKITDGFDNTYKFASKTQDTAIFYFRCYTWLKKDSIFAKKKVRVALRDWVYQQMEATGYKPVLSFFPLALNGIRELGQKEANVSALEILRGQKVKIYLPTTANLKPYKPLAEALQTLETRFGVNIKIIPREDISSEQFHELIDSHAEHHVADAGLTGTGISILDPKSDIRFMILAKEGIRLPDDDGSLHATVKDENFSPQHINEIIWEQALAWPLFHTSSGIWVKDSVVDLSLFNHLLPFSEFEWIGAK